MTTMPAPRPTGEIGASVVEQAKRGDQEAFAAVIRHYDPGLRARAYRLLGDRDRMDDALQDAYLKAYRALPRFRGASRLGTWLYRIAYNACLDELERSQRIIQLPLGEATEPRDTRAAVAETVASRPDLAEALAALAPEDRATVLLIDAQGFNYRDAGEVLGVPQGTIASRLNRARVALRRVLGAPAAGGPNPAPLGRARGRRRRGGGDRSRCHRHSAHGANPTHRGAGVRNRRPDQGEGAGGAHQHAQPERVLVFDGPEKGDERRWRFTLTAEGDFRLIGPTDEERIAYDASTGVARSVQTSASLGGDTLFYAVRRGVAPGPPDQGPPTWIIPDQFGAFVRALLAAEDPRVREIAYEGRPAWRLEIDAVPNAIVPDFSGDRFEITVDRKTGIPVRVLETKNSAFLSEVRIENLALNADLPPHTFRLAFPHGAEVMRSDDGFRRVTLGEVAGIVGYAPLVPARVPAGYELAEAAVAREAFPTGSEAGNPPSRMVVSLSYRRGLDQFLVTTRLSRVPSEVEPELPPAEVWGDPLATGEGFVDKGEQLTIGRGALEGQRVELVLVPRGIPHLWALTDELVVTVGGDLSRAELVRVTESLRRWR